jgi:hypothetical protein
MEARTSYLFVTLLCLTGAAGAVLVAEAGSGARREQKAEAFQRLVGGVGFGAAVDLSECAFGFDPRIDGSCAYDRGPVPGGACFCPRHAGSLLSYPPLWRGQPVPHLWATPSGFGDEPLP